MLAGTLDKGTVLSVYLLKLAILFCCILITANQNIGVYAEMKNDENETKVGYRVLPRRILHPSKNRIFTEEEFNNLERKKLHTANSLCEGHTETVTWYVTDSTDRRFYVLQIKLKDQQDIFIESVCTFAPYQGMDQIDGMFAADAEEYVLHKKLGRSLEALKVFQEKDELLLDEYLKARNLPFEIETVEQGLIVEGNSPIVNEMGETTEALGVETSKGTFVPIIPANARVPGRIKQGITTSRDNQDYIALKLFRGNDKSTRRNHPLGGIKISGIPSAPKGDPDIEITFSITEAKQILVSAKDIKSGKVLEVSKIE